MNGKQGYLLRVEGVNLSNFVYDTKELSVIRGGGLLLLDAVSFVEIELAKNADNVVAVSTGASSGLFEFTPKDGKSGSEVRNEIERLLNDAQKYRPATFVVDIIEAKGTFADAKERLLAKNRWRQMQSPSLAIPKHRDDYSSSCDSDRVRPAFPGKKTSSSAWQRLQYGREQKRGKLYTTLTNLPEDNAKFTNDLNGLSADSSKGNLNHKIAVIYADGNSFGALQSGFDKDTLQRFDKEIKEYRKSFLAELIKQMDGDPVAWKNGDKYRLETLLWGGDEFILVVPAWKGWETLQLFYKLSEKWDFKYQGDDKKEIIKKLTHSAGLVFCHHNAPIHRIKNLALDLAEVCKNEKIVGKKDNYFVCQTLESFDYISGPVETYLQKMSIDQKVRPMILSGADMATIAKSIAGIKDDPEFARGRLHGIVKQYRTGKAEDAEKETETIKKSVGTETIQLLDDLEIRLGKGYCCLHLADLYDYIAAQEVKTNA